VKDPLSVHALIAAKPAQAPSRCIAQEIRIEDFQALGRKPASAVITAVKDLPHTTSSGASLLPVATPSAMEASSKVEAIASVRARKATTEEQVPLVATGLKKSAMAQEMEMVMGPAPTPVVLAAVKDRPGDLSCKSPASVAAKQEHVDGLDGTDQNLLARAKYTARLRNKELLTTLYTSSSPVVAPAAAVEQSSSAHTFISALPAHPIEDLVSFAFVEATENIGDVHGSAVLAAVKDPPCRTPEVLLLPTNKPVEFMGIFTMDTPRSEAVYASPAPSTVHAPMREHAAE
jgi:hypothetical protein